MATYDNLTLATTTLTFSGQGNQSIGAATFDLSTLDFLSNVPLKDQIEVERIFDTGLDTRYASITFTIEDRRRMFILPKTWYSIDENTKVLTVSIPADTFDTNGKYYPDSRTYQTVGGQTLLIPQNLSNTTTTTNTNPNSPFIIVGQSAIRGPDIVYIRRKTLSKDSIVTFAPGTRLTTTQLNLQFNQLKFAVQEIMSRLRNDVIYKYDENAVDGPFLGGGDLKMSSNYVKGLNSPSLTSYLTNISTNVVETYLGKTYAVNHEKLAEALVQGTVHRTGITDGDGVAFAGDHTASNLKITSLAAGTADTDAARMDQIRSASTLTSGTLDPARIASGSLSLGKLSNASNQGYTLPNDALPIVNTSVGSYGSATASNSNNMLYITADNKGRITGLQNRNFDSADLPTVSSLTAGNYGSTTTSNTSNMVAITVDSKGRVTSATQRNLQNADLPTSGVIAGTYGSSSGTAAGALSKVTVNSQGIVTAASSRSIEVNDLPSDSITGAGSYGQTTASNVNNMVRFTYDSKGRVTSASHRNMDINDLPSSIPLTKLSTSLSQGWTLPADSIANSSITLAKIDFTSGTVPASSIPSINLSTINPATYGSFVLPEACVPAVSGLVQTTYNTYPVKDFTVDAKGRVISVTQRVIADGDIPSLSASKITSGTFADSLIPAPTTAPTAGTYGSNNQVPVITVDAKGRINTITTSAALTTASLSNFATASNALIDARALSKGAGSVYDALSTKISNVADPISPQDVVTKNYFTTNALVSSGGIITAGGSAITNMTMRASASITENDAVNYGFIQNLVLTPGTTLIGSTTPQIYRDAWSALSKTSGHLTGFDRYQRTFTDLGAVNSFMILLGADSVTKTFVPYSAAAVGGGSPTVHDGYFWLDTSGGSNKVLNIWITTGATPSGNIVTRNFGLSRLVSGSVATTSSTGLVSILSGNDGGIAVDGSGVLSLKPATSTQIGGVKVGAGLTATSGSISVNLTDTTNTTSSTIAASATAVKAAYDLANTVSNSLTTTNNNVTTAQSAATAAQSTANSALAKTGGTMTGMILLPASTTNLVPLRFVGGSAPNTATDGDIWYESNTLKFKNASGIKTLAFTDSSLTGSAASANTLTTGRSILLGGDLSGSAVFNGSTDVTINATIQPDSVALGTDTTGNYVATISSGTGITVSGSGTENAGVTITNSDRGSSQNIFKTVTAGSTSVTAASNNATLTIQAGSGITVSGDDTTKTVTITNSSTPPNVFSTVSVAGTALVADQAADTLSITAGSGITLTPDSTNDSFSIANSGVLSIAGTSNQITTSASTGAVTLSLPQSIGTSSNVQFNQVTANGVVVGSAANTIGSSTSSLTLTPATTNISGIAAITGNATVGGTLGVTGAVTLASSLTFSGSAAVITLGGGNATIVQNASTAVTGVSAVGDMYLRVPANGKIFAIKSNTTTTAPVAGDELITSSALTTALSPYALSSAVTDKMLITGSLASGTGQVIGTSTNNWFTIKTSNTDRLNITGAGVSQFLGNVNVMNTAGTAAAITLGQDGKIQGTSTQSTDAGTILATKDYIDTLISGFNTSATPPIGSIVFGTFNGTSGAGATTSEPSGISASNNNIFETFAINAGGYYGTVHFMRPIAGKGTWRLWTANVTTNTSAQQHLKGNGKLYYYYGDVNSSTTAYTTANNTLFGKLPVLYGPVNATYYANSGTFIAIRVA